MTDNRLVTLSFDVSTNRLFEAFFANEDVAAIIRCHFEAERAAAHVLSKLTAGRCKPSSNMVRYFGQKLEMLRIIGIDPKALSPLAIHNEHRNKFMHGGQVAITTDQLEELHESVLKIIPKFGEMQFKFPDIPGFDRLYKDLSDRQKYVGNMMGAIWTFASIPDIVRPAADAVAPASP